MVLTGRTTLLRCASTLTLCAIGSHALSSPLPVRDQNPLLAGFDVPAALPAQLFAPDRWTLDASFAWGNSAIVQTNARETLIVDAETRELRMAFGRFFADGYALRVELPYRQTNAGRLDSFIDGWHDFFSLPEGVRPDLPRDSLRIGYERDDRWLIDASSSHSGLGDVSLQLGKQFLGRPSSECCPGDEIPGDTALTAWLALKLPTGDADEFTGSGGVDVTAALAFQHELSQRYSVFAQAAGTWLGEGDRMPAHQRNVAWSGVAGLSARALQDLTLTVQLDAHTAVFESGEDFLGDAVMLTLGGTYRIADWNLSFAVTEDIAIESSADVVFLFRFERAND